MKLLTRISSIRRIAWNACRSCSPHSLSMWRGLVGQPARRRVHPLAGVVERPGDRVLGQPVDLQVRVQLAQLVGDRHVAARVAEPDRRGQVERPRGGRARPASQVAAGRSAGAIRSTNSADQPVDQHRVARLVPVAAALDEHQRRRRSARPSRSPIGVRADPVVGAVDDDAPGSCTRSQNGSIGAHTAPSQPSRPAVVSTSVDGAISCAQPTQSSICLVECGSVNISAKKNRTEVVVVAVEPVVLVVLRPAPGGVDAVAPASRRRGRGDGQVEPAGGADREEPAHPLRVVRGQRAPPRPRRRRARPATARSVPVASSTASASAAYSALVYAAAPSGRPESPLPRPSNVTTR